MGLFERMSRVARAEANYIKSQSIDPEAEINRTISMLQDAVAKTRFALAKAPADQRSILTRNLTDLEIKLADIKVKKDALKSRAAAVRANESLQNTISGLNTGSAMSAFERMEEKVLMMEAKSQAARELIGADLEAQFAMLEFGSDVDVELAAMKAQLTGGSVSQQALPITEEKKSLASNSAIDDELEALRKQIDSL
jgi:phage shock protein A